MDKLKYPFTFAQAADRDKTSFYLKDGSLVAVVPNGVREEPPGKGRPVAIMGLWNPLFKMFFEPSDELAMDVAMGGPTILRIGPEDARHFVGFRTRE